jgi:putative phosphoesterase
MVNMRIGVVSDTHIPETGPDVPSQVYAAFQGVDMILHAGGMHIISVLDWFGSIAPVLGARGNGDYPTRSNRHRPGVPEDSRVKESHVFIAEGVSIGLIHGFPLPEEVPWRTTEELFQMYFGQAVDIVVCGDTHVPRID